MKQNYFQEYGEIMNHCQACQRAAHELKSLEGYLERKLRDEKKLKERLKEARTTFRPKIREHQAYVRSQLETKAKRILERSKNLTSSLDKTNLDKTKYVFLEKVLSGCRECEEYGYKSAKVVKIMQNYESEGLSESDDRLKKSEEKSNDSKKNQGDNSRIEIVKGGKIYF